MYIYAIDVAAFIPAHDICSALRPFLKHPWWVWQRLSCLAPRFVSGQRENAKTSALAVNADALCVCL